MHKNHHTSEKLQTRGLMVMKGCSKCLWSEDQWIICLGFLWFRFLRLKTYMKFWILFAFYNINSLHQCEVWGAISQKVHYLDTSTTLGESFSHFLPVKTATDEVKWVHYTVFGLSIIQHVFCHLTTVHMYERTRFMLNYEW